tara:strand:- start:35 stop:379 length:345 start_codon:yes stop_codon:yes gene_type:complete
LNPKLFIADLAFLLFFVSEGIETHNSDSSFLEILLPFVISMILILPIFYKIGFLKVDKNPEYIKSLRVWISMITIGVLIRFVMDLAFEPLFLLVIVAYTLATSGTIRLIHKQFL